MEMNAPAVSRKPYPSDISDEEWSLVFPYLTLMKEDAPQREFRCGSCSMACAM